MADQKNATWTIMLYIVADGALANFAVDSLKQLNQSAGVGHPKLVVGAQFAFPLGTLNPSSPSEKATPTKPHFLFKRGSGGSPDANDKIRNELLNLAGKSEAANKVAAKSQKDMLKDFLLSVYQDKECKASRYALILWGHGPELLLQPGVSNPINSSRMYISPEELRQALSESKSMIPEGASLDIVGFDACFISMFEMAYELKDQTKYMIASQDDVPDASFPYNKIVELFRKYGNNSELLLKEGVDAYVATYGGCICDPATGMNPVTLSVLQLEKCGDLKQAVNGLASALLAAPDVEEFRNLLLEAREKSQDYAGGLYVDLHEFCENLSEKPNNSKPPTNSDTTEEWKTKIEEACQKVLNALKLAGDGTSKGLILKNGSDGPRNHGISIYLPYLTNRQYAQVNKPLVKGGSPTHGSKGFGDALSGAATEYMMCARRDLILDTESYYGCLQLAKDTKWYSFITDRWTKVLIRNVPAYLDFHYSAQQSWINLLRGPANLSKHCEPGHPLNGATRVRRRK